MKKLLLLAAGLLAVTAGRAADEARRASAAAESLIAADNARDVGQVLAHYTDDALLLPPNQAPYGGKPAIRERYTTLFAANEISFRIAVAEAEVSGDLAFLRGEITGTRTPLDRARPAVPVHDKFLMILRRQPDGAWKVARLMWGPVKP